MYTFADGAFSAGESPWEEEEEEQSTQVWRCCTGEDLLVTVNLLSSICPEDYKFEM